MDLPPRDPCAGAPFGQAIVDRAFKVIAGDLAVDGIADADGLGRDGIGKIKSRGFGAAKAFFHPFDEIKAVLVGRIVHPDPFVQFGNRTTRSIRGGKAAGGQRQRQDHKGAAAQTVFLRRRH